MKAMEMRRRWDVVPGVGRLRTLFANLYTVESQDGAWVLLDTGLGGFAGRIRRAVEKRFGSGARPRAIVLTHGHHDHAGNAKELAEWWDVPVWSHRLELPYLTGRSLYPPEDPSLGGPPAWLSRLVHSVHFELGGRVRALPEGGEVPFLPQWRWRHTPGHSPGHIVLFREADRTLLTGDALVTTDLETWRGFLTGRRRFGPPPSASTPDWDAARQSLRALAGLAPRTVAAGHGSPWSGPHVAAELRAFAETMPVPRRGRYVPRPARFHPDGSVAWLPPPVPDPIGDRALLVAGIALLTMILAGLSGCVP